MYLFRHGNSIDPVFHLSAKEAFELSPDVIITTITPCFHTGYGFVDFDSPAAAQKAVTALKSSGVQAQMAKVRNHRLFYSKLAYNHIVSLHQASS